MWNYLAGSGLALWLLVQGGAATATVNGLGQSKTTGETTTQAFPHAAIAPLPVQPASSLAWAALPAIAVDDESPVTRRDFLPRHDGADGLPGIAPLSHPLVRRLPG
ncbi:MAG: hypothetical protein IGR92_05370 [Leptolyngbyaceae cyanobacterium T60_A2020_046]|nr:hypothetical protein [Leptolyngbyaceae cyanobacterium T60_A2020_046]